MLNQYLWIILVVPVIFAQSVEQQPGETSDNAAIDDNHGYDSDIWGTWYPENYNLMNCRKDYNLILLNSTEYDKWGSAIAATIMALVPTLLAFGPLKTAQIGRLMQLAAPLGFCAAAFTFGFPIDELCTNNAEVITMEQLRTKCEPEGNDGTGTGAAAASQSGTGSATGMYNTPPIGNSSHRLTIVSRVFSEDKGAVTATTKPKPISTINTKEITETIIKRLSEKRPRRVVVNAVRALFVLLQVLPIGLLFVAIPSWEILALFWLCPGKGAMLLGLWLWASVFIIGLLRGYYQSWTSGIEHIIHVSKINEG